MSNAPQLNLTGINIQVKYLAIGFSILVFSCGLFETEDENNNSGIVYVALQGLDQVGIVNTENGELKVLDIDYNASMQETPHFIVIDEINRYWFVTTISSGYVGRYNLDTDELIDTLFIGDSPALMVVNEMYEKLYVSRMMPMGGMGAVSTTVQEINYENSSHMVLSNEFELSSPAPHGLATNSDRSEVYVASNTADWLYKLFPFTAERDSVVMDASIVNSPDMETQRLKPIQIVSMEDSLLFITCSAGKWFDNNQNVYIPGQIQLWDSNSMTLIDILEFDWKASPWHIITSPSSRMVYAALKGEDNYPGSAGVVGISFESDTLSLVVENYSEDFQSLHGIDISSDGQTLFVSGMRDGHLHLFNASDLQLLKSISLGENYSFASPGGVKAK